MSLGEHDRRRYARHLAIAELGESGQERLLATTVRLAPTAHPFAAEVAGRYLAASGVTVAESGRCAFPVLLASPGEITARATRSELERVEAALAGTLAALEVVRGVVGWETRRRQPLSPLVGDRPAPSSAEGAGVRSDAAPTEKPR
ncbi:MAG: hypothetical protein IT379_05350 [Deltaproteobacteria bacterium]|nr:hypothetical protein [Deltaproteobacteria bacterium]